jgi:hypothetical protein
MKAATELIDKGLVCAASRKADLRRSALEVPAAES